MTLVPTRKRIMDKAQSAKIPLEFWFQLLGGVDKKKDLLKIPEQYAFIKDIQCLWTLYLSNAKK